MASHSPESLEALAAGDKEARRWEVYRHFCCCPEHGATTDKIAVAIGLMPNQISGRLGELVDAGLITPLRAANGKKVRRRTRTGCWAAVCVATQFSPREAREPELLFPDPEPREMRHRDDG